MKVQEYRDLISALSDTFASLCSAANPKEQIAEAERVRKAAREVLNAECPTAKSKDRERAQKWINTVSTYLVRHGHLRQPYVY